ncbi:MAG: enoyl-CoA hydratase/isomerase family protein [Burkholderiales bacterium]
MSEEENLRVERRDGCLWITLNRAEKANALAVAMMEGATAALNTARADENVRAVLLTGAGDRVFCAGADVREKPRDGDMNAHRKRRSAALARLLDGIMDMPKPVITALNGTASGGGAMIALLSDARIAVDSATISLPEIDLGMPTFTGATIAEHVGGLALAVDLVQTGRRMPVAEAFSRGLVTCVVTRAELERAAVQVAEMLAKKDGAAFAANKVWLNRNMKAALAEAREEHDRHRRQQ